jgi:3'(2'), 5'-bisphosphate nucleotidase
LDAIDRGNYTGGASGRHWALDPIDGTKGFLRGGQYAVCLALIVDGIVQVGVVGCPNLPIDHKNPDGERGSLFIAVRGHGAYQRTFKDEAESHIQFADISSTKEATFCESVEAGHSSHGDAEEIAKLLGITREPVRMDSQAKYCSISRGDADIYLRLPTSKTYVEKIWVSWNRKWE